MRSWGKVIIAGLEDYSLTYCHRAYLDQEEEWNGWLRPYFEKDEVLRMNRWLPIFDDRIYYVEKEDTFYCTYDPDRPDAFSGVDIDGMHLYPVGNGSWTWSAVEVPDESTYRPALDAKAAGRVFRNGEKPCPWTRHAF